MGTRIRVFPVASGDVNRSNRVDIVDAMLVARYNVRLITTLPIPIITPALTLTPTPIPSFEAVLPLADESRRICRSR